MTTESNNDKHLKGATGSSEPEAVVPVATTTIEPDEMATKPLESKSIDIATTPLASDEVAPTVIEPVEEADQADADEDEVKDEPSQAAPATPMAAAKSTSASGGSNLPAKVLVVVLILVFAAGAFIFIQSSSSKPRSFNLSKDDMKLLFQEMVPPQKQQEIAANPEEKKKFVEEVRKLMSVAQVAESEGYGKRPEVQSQTALQVDLNLNQAYRKKHPEFKATDEQVAAYYQAHPNEFDTFVQTNPRFQQQAQGPQREAFKKQYGEFKVAAELARKENLDQDAVTRLAILLDSSQILQGAYLSDLDKNSDKLVSDAEIDDYYKEHPGDFEEVRVRHVLISTQPKPDDHPGGKPGDDKDAKPKVPSSDEARKKAQEVLDRARKGDDFAKLAEQYSDDPGSNKKGGEYDFFPRGQMIPEFDNVAFALKPGEISDIVPTQFGFHIIKLEARRPGPPPSDPKVRQRIIDKMKQKKIEERIAEITKDSKVAVPEDFEMVVKPAEMPPAMGAPPSQQQ
jgi:peptidyl-prolyl cis-trans isomerase C